MSNKKQARTTQKTILEPQPTDPQPIVAEWVVEEEPKPKKPKPKKKKKKSKKKRKKVKITYYYEEDDSCFDKVLYCAYDSLVGWWRD